MTLASVRCALALILTTFNIYGYRSGLSYRQLIATSSQCTTCAEDWRTPPAFCNIVAAPLPNYKTYIAKIFDENDKEDPCYCGKVGSIFYEREPGQLACGRIPDICKTLSKEEVCKKAGSGCDGSHWSTFHCTCADGWQGQLCNIPLGAGRVVKNPILVHYLYTPLFQRQISPEPPLLPGLYFITESLGDDFELIVGFDDGRRIQVRPPSFTKKNYREECLTDIREKIHYTSEYYCNLIPEGNVYGYGIFLDKMVRINLLSSDNLVTINKTYGFKSAGRFSSLDVQVKNSNRVSWEWDTFKVFVPYQRHFILGSRRLQLQGCGEAKEAPSMKSIAEPVILKASHDLWPWFDNFSARFAVDDHRWYIEDITDPDELDDLVPPPRIPVKYSQGADGRTKIIPKGELSEGKYLVMYDFIQEWLGWGKIEDPIDTQFVTRKLCYFDIVGTTKLEVYLHTQSKSAPCNRNFSIEVKNYNSLHYDNERLRISWKCEGSNTPECVEKTTRGIQPYRNVLRCGVRYRFTANVTHPRSPRYLLYQVEINSEDQNVSVEIQCVESCEYKVNPDRFLYLQATEIPAVSTSWIWEIREVIRSGGGHETVGNDLVSSFRQPDTEAFICIVPPDTLTRGKEYRAYAKTPAAYSSYTFLVNKPPEGGKCSVEPTSGISLETEFRIVCEGWTDDDQPLTFRVLEIPDVTGPEVNTLVCSESSVIEKLKFRRSSITVEIIDSLGLAVQHNLTVPLTKPTKPINREDIMKIITDINIKLDGDAQVAGLTTIDELTKMIEDQNIEISEDISLKLLDIVARIDASDNPCALEKVIDVLNRILKLKTTEPKEKVDKILLLGSEILRKFADIANDLSERNQFNSLFDKDIVASSISNASCTILLAKDPVIGENTVSEDVHEEHLHRVNTATDNVLHTMATLGDFLTKSVKYQMRKYIVRKDCFNILGKFGNGSQIRDELNKIDFLDEYYKNDSANVGVIDLTEDTFWGVPNGMGLLGVVAQFFNSTPKAKGPIEFSMQVPNYHDRFAMISGNHKALLACYTETRLDKSFNIHHILLPDGEGVVVLNFLPEIVGKVKVFAHQSIKPNYANATSSPTLNSTDAYIKFSNRNHSIDSSFYVAIIAANEGSNTIEYNFTYRVLRCAIYTGSQFVSRGCTFNKLVFRNHPKEPTVHCRCNLSSHASSSTSWFSVNIITPPHSLVLSNDIFLFTTVLENFYTTLLVSVVLFTLIVVLLWGYRLDCIDERCRKIIVMEDNYPGDNYAYVIAVFTGQGIGSGTSSRVAIRVFGNLGYSRVHMLEHRWKRTLASGQDDWFLMTTAVRLGHITRIQLWHNHVGRSPEWYCKKISIFDLEDHNKYDFIIERWFTFDVRVTLDDARSYEGQVATQAEVTKKWYFLVGGWIYSEMREKHHLASIFRRHPRSLYTRCQRVIISVTFITTTMLVSLMFFKLDEVGPADWPVIPFKLRDIWTGIKSSIISSLITSAVVICFGFHKKYERASLKKGPKFEVTDDPDESEENGKEKSTRRAKRGKRRFASFQTIWLKIVKPNPIEYKPVVFGVKRAKKKRLSLVFLCAGWFVALHLTIVTVVASITISVNSFFVVLYGLKFGPKKSMVWALTFLTGTFSNGIIFAPLKMAILGLIVALTFKKSYLDSYTMQIQVDHSKLSNKGYMERLKMNFHMRLRGHYKPVQTTELERIRSQKLKGREFTYLLTHFVMATSMFAVVVLLATLLGVRDGFYEIKQLTELFTEGEYDRSANRVWNSTNMYMFFSKTALPAVHRLRWYNNKTLEVERNERKADSNSPRYQSQVKGFVKDYTNKLVGIPRLRQLRLSNSSYNNRKVPKIFQRYRSNAMGHYDFYSEDRQSYLPSWVLYNGYHGFLEQSWAYHPPSQTKTGTTQGYSLIQYGGGGYVMPLSWNLGFSLRRLKYLDLNNWLTNRTRCAFFEINVFNNNMKHFSVMRFIVETLPAGIYRNRPHMDVVSIHLSGRPNAQAVLLLVTILLVQLVSYSVLSIWHSSKDGLLAYLSTWRGFSDILLISLGLLTVSSQYNRALHFSLVTEYLDKEPRDKYTSLFSPLRTKEQAIEIFCVFCLILVFNITCTFIKFKIYTWMNRVISNVYKVWVAAFLILNFYGILIGVHSITQDTELKKLFILQFTLKEKIFHKFNQESKVLYVLFTPIIYALFKFYIGHLASSQEVYSVEWKLPRFWTLGRYLPKKPISLPRRRGKPKRPVMRRSPRGPTTRRIRKVDDSFKLIK